MVHRNRIPIVIPGIMGSTLSYGGQPIWADNIRDNYNRLRTNSSLLSWKGQVADAKLWKVVHFSKLVPFLGLPLWNQTLDYLENGTALSPVVECPYDWRQSLKESCKSVFYHVQSATGLSLTRPSTGAEPQLVVLTHSMGALLFRVAYALDLVHPSRIDRVIHLAPPLLGAPVAFRSMVDRTTLPFLNEYVRLVRFVNYSRLITILYECFRTFPSMYELLPPARIAFLQNDNYERYSPFDDDQFDKALMREAISTHELLAQADVKLLQQSSLPVYTIFSQVNFKTRTESEYRVEKLGRDRYGILEVYSSVYGDGTVLSDSARASDASKRCPLHDVDHASMPNSRRAVELLRGCGV